MPRADAGGPTAGDPGVTQGCAGRVLGGPMGRVPLMLSRSYLPSCEVRTAEWLGRAEAEAPYAGSCFHPLHENKTHVMANVQACRAPADVLPPPSRLLKASSE